jgi:hypothetical protein
MAQESQVFDAECDHIVTGTTSWSRQGAIQGFEPAHAVVGTPPVGVTPSCDGILPAAAPSALRKKTGRMSGPFFLDCEDAYAVSVCSSTRVAVENPVDPGCLSL